MNESLAPANISGLPTRSPWALPADSLTVLYGESGMARLAHYFLPGPLLMGKRVLLLDGANQFSPLLIARFARSHGLAPGKFNQCIRVARAFTCFQLTELLLRAPRFLLESPAEVLIVTALPDLYFDEDVREREAAASFDHALEGLRLLARPRLAVGVFSGILSFNTARRRFFRKLAEQADSVLKLETHADNRISFERVKHGAWLLS